MTFVRDLDPGMGQAVAERTVLRKKQDGSWENWGEVADRVAVGNVSLGTDEPVWAIRQSEEYITLHKHIAKASILMSGRHLQHGDETQSTRNMEIFTNCATAATSFALFYLLLNGSGVGRAYDDDMMLANWDNSPALRVVLDSNHPDFDYSAHESARDARHKYGSGKDVMWFEVPDSREGWAKALELWENATFEKIHRDKLLILDFTNVRPKGAPIKGMQNKPSSGPVPLMNAFMKAASLKGSGLAPWKQAMYIDHYFAECVLVGGARRCLPEGTIVTTSTGSKLIENIIVGDVIKTIKGEHKVTATFDQGIQKTIIIRHEFGNFECTPNHRVAVFNTPFTWEFKEAKDLISGDRLVYDPTGWESDIVTKLPIHQKTEQQLSSRNTTGIDIFVPELDEDLAWMIGAFHGNGSVSIPEDGHGSLSFACHSNRSDIVEKFAKQIARFGVNPKISQRSEENTIDVRVRCVQLATYFKTNIKKNGSGDLEVPAFISNARKSIRASYLAGIFDTDGCATNRPMTVMSSVCLQFLKELQTLCLSLGFLTSTSSSKKTRRPSHWKPIYNLVVKGGEGRNRFLEVVSPYSIKATEAPAYKVSRGLYSFPTPMVDEYRKGNKFPGKLTPNENQTTDWLSRKNGLSFSALPVEFKGIEEGREVHTYDIEVDEIHQFTANGFVVHNSARMSTKSWRDPNVVDFIKIKRPIEFSGKSLDEVVEFRKENPMTFSFLWSSNNSVTVDAEFWQLLELKRTEELYKSELAVHARKVFKLITECSYGDGTGEPGLINQDRLVHNNEGFEDLTKGDYIGSERYQLNEDTQLYLAKLAKKTKKKKYVMITNPCGEIALHQLGGYCTIADVVPFHADSLDEAEEAFRATTRALIRVNTMNCLYAKEVKRTNRIGVGITGIHEFAWKFFGFGFRDLIDEEKSKSFWETIKRFSDAVVDEATKYSKKLGVNVPHTMTTIKPAGTTSKLFGLTEGWHLPSMPYYLRWVQFRHDDPLVKVYQEAGYPVRELQQYQGTIIVGFPTAPTITKLGIEDKLVTAGEATPEEQYQWLMLGEKYWLGDVAPNQISYTLKYVPESVSYSEFKEMLLKYQSKIRCCSVMPQEDAVAFEYQPEQQITKAQYEQISRSIKGTVKEDIDKVHVDCANGACPVDFIEKSNGQEISNNDKAQLH